MQKPPDDQIWAKVSTSFLSTRCYSSPALHSQCFWSRWLELDYNQHLVSTFLCLSGRFYWKSHLLPLVWSYASSKWEMAHFPLHFPFTIHRECLVVFKPSLDQKNPAQPKPTTQRKPSYSAQCCCTGTTAGRASSAWFWYLLQKPFCPHQRGTHITFADHLDAW